MTERARAQRTRWLFPFALVVATAAAQVWTADARADEPFFPGAPVRSPAPTPPPPSEPPAPAAPPASAEPPPAPMPSPPGQDAPYFPDSNAVEVESQPVVVRIDGDRAVRSALVEIGDSTCHQLPCTVDVSPGQRELHVDIGERSITLGVRIQPSTRTLVLRGVLPRNALRTGLGIGSIIALVAGGVVIVGAGENPVTPSADVGALFEFAAGFVLLGAGAALGVISLLMTVRPPTASVEATSRFMATRAPWYERMRLVGGPLPRGTGGALGVAVSW